MDITGINVGVTSIRPADEPAAEGPVEVAALSAAHLRAGTRQGQDGPELVMHDDTVEVTVSHDMGSVEQAVLGLRRLGDAAYAHAHLLETRAARRRGYS
jgi:hypothetical protein